MADSPSIEIEKSELYCWPCQGIIANIDDDPCTEQVATFEGNWSGFKNAMKFEKSFYVRGQTKDEWFRRRTSSPGSSLYGWVAREDDFKSHGSLGDYLRRNSTLKTIPELIHEAKTNRDKALRDLNELPDNYLQNTKMLLPEHENIYRTHTCLISASVKLQHIAKKLGKGLLEEEEMLNFEMETKMRRLDSWRKELNKRAEALEAKERRILQVEKTMGLNKFAINRGDENSPSLANMKYGKVYQRRKEKICD